MKKVVKFDFLFLVYVCFTFLPIIPNKLKGLPVVLLFITSIILSIRSKNTLPFDLKKTVLMSSPYIILLPSLIYTDNLTRVDKILSTSLSLIIIPVSFNFFMKAGISLSYEKFKKIINYFVLGGAVYAITILFYLYKIGFFSGEKNLSESMSYIGNYMFNISQHPIYASIFLAVPFLLLLIKLVEERKTLLTVLFLIIQILPICIVLFLLTRKGVLLAIVVSIFLLINLLFNSIKSKILIFGSTLVILILTYQIPSIQERFSELFNSTSYEKVNMGNSTSIRNAIYECSFSKIKESPFIGYGLGDVRDELEKCYKDKGFPFKHVYGSHNQFLSYFLSSGILGFITLVLYILIILIKSVKQKKKYLPTIILFFGIIMLFENILERQSGVILFSFLVMFFYFYEPLTNLNLKEEVNEN